MLVKIKHTQEKSDNIYFIKEKKKRDVSKLSCSDKLLRSPVTSIHSVGDGEELTAARQPPAALVC